MLQHHQPKHDPERLWIDKLEPKVVGLRSDLAEMSPDDIARHSGAILEDGHLTLAMLFEDYIIDTADYVVAKSDGSEVNSFMQSLVLTYLATADGSHPAGRWVSFRDLPGGYFYNQAFQGYAADRLAKRWQLDLGGFEAACRARGGAPLGYGDAGFTFTVLPRVDIAAVYWLGDEDFASKASILFDADAATYMVIDGLAIIGNRLVDYILTAG